MISKNNTEQHVSSEYEELIHLLNKLYVKEWRLSYNFFVGSEFLKKTIKNEFSNTLDILSLQDRKHAKVLLERILDIGGLPIENPLESSDEPLLGKFEPSKMVTKWISERQNLISMYEECLKKYDNRFHVTMGIIKNILIEEKNSELDLHNLNTIWQDSKNLF